MGSVFKFGYIKNTLCTDLFFKDVACYLSLYLAFTCCIHIVMVLHSLYWIFASRDVHQSLAGLSIAAPLRLEIVIEIW